jgi:hypothetical protein
MVCCAQQAWGCSGGCRISGRSFEFGDELAKPFVVVEPGCVVGGLVVGEPSGPRSAEGQDQGNVAEAGLELVERFGQPQDWRITILGVLWHILDDGQARAVISRLVGAVRPWELSPGKGSVAVMPYRVAWIRLVQLWASGPACPALTALVTTSGRLRKW